MLEQLIKPVLDWAKDPGHHTQPTVPIHGVESSPPGGRKRGGGHVATSTTPDVTPPPCRRFPSTLRVGLARGVAYGVPESDVPA
jgi:hypothetical protein